MCKFSRLLWYVLLHVASMSNSSYAIQQKDDGLISEEDLTAQRAVVEDKDLAQTAYLVKLATDGNAALSNYQQVRLLGRFSLLCDCKLETWVKKMVDLWLADSESLESIFAWAAKQPGLVLDGAVSVQTLQRGQGDGRQLFVDLVETASRVLSFLAKFAAASEQISSILEPTLRPTLTKGFTQLLAAVSGKNSATGRIAAMKTALGLVRPFSYHYEWLQRDADAVGKSLGRLGNYVWLMEYARQAMQLVCACHACNLVIDGPAGHTVQAAGRPASLEFWSFFRRVVRASLSPGRSSLLGLDLKLVVVGAQESMAASFSRKVGSCLPQIAELVGGALFCDSAPAADSTSVPRDAAELCRLDVDGFTAQFARGSAPSRVPGGDVVAVSGMAETARTALHLIHGMACVRSPEEWHRLLLGYGPRCRVLIDHVLRDGVFLDGSALCAMGIFSAASQHLGYDAHALVHAPGLHNTLECALAAQLSGEEVNQLVSLIGWFRSEQFDALCKVRNDWGTVLLAKYGEIPAVSWLVGDPCTELITNRDVVRSPEWLTAEFGFDVSCLDQWHNRDVDDPVQLIGPRKCTPAENLQSVLAGRDPVEAWNLFAAGFGWYALLPLHERTNQFVMGCANSLWSHEDLDIVRAFLPDDRETASAIVPKLDQLTPAGQRLLSMVLYRNTISILHGKDLWPGVLRLMDADVNLEAYYLKLFGMCSNLCPLVVFDRSADAVTFCNQVYTDTDWRQDEFVAWKSLFLPHGLPPSHMIDRESRLGRTDARCMTQGIKPIVLELAGGSVIKRYSLQSVSDDVKFEVVAIYLPTGCILPSGSLREQGFVNLVRIRDGDFDRRQPVDEITDGTCNLLYGYNTAEWLDWTDFLEHKPLLRLGCLIRHAKPSRTGVERFNGDRRSAAVWFVSESCYRSVRRLLHAVSSGVGWSADSDNVPKGFMPDRIAGRSPVVTLQLLHHWLDDLKHEANCLREDMDGAAVLIVDDTVLAADPLCCGERAGQILPLSMLPGFYFMDAVMKKLGAAALTSTMSRPTNTTHMAALTYLGMDLPNWNSRKSVAAWSTEWAGSPKVMELVEIAKAGASYVFAKFLARRGNEQLVDATGWPFAVLPRDVETGRVDPFDRKLRRFVREYMKSLDAARNPILAYAIARSMLIQLGVAPSLLSDPSAGLVDGLF